MRTTDSMHAPSSRLALATQCVYATDFLRAAKGTSTATGAAFSPARQYLACHALELVLKAYLQLRGKSVEATGVSDSRPDLGSLFTQADSNGLSELVHLTARQRIEIRKAALYYSEGVFEYPALAEALRGYPQAPDLNVLLGVLGKLVSAVRDASIAAI